MISIYSSRNSSSSRSLYFYYCFLCIRCLCSCFVICHSCREETAAAAAVRRPSWSASFIVTRWPHHHQHHIMLYSSSRLLSSSSSSATRRIVGRTTAAAFVSSPLYYSSDGSRKTSSGRRIQQQQQQQQQHHFLVVPIGRASSSASTVVAFRHRQGGRDYYYDHSGHCCYSSFPLLLSTAFAVAAVVAENHTDTTTSCAADEAVVVCAIVATAASSSSSSSALLPPRGGGQEEPEEPQQPEDEQQQQQQKQPDAAAAAAVLFATSPSPSPSSSSPLQSSSSPADLVSSNVVFPPEILQHDHYNGVTIHLDRISSASSSASSAAASSASCDSSSLSETSSLSSLLHFEQTLQSSLLEWKKQGKKGIWIHVPRHEVDKIPICIGLGFQFHMVLPGEPTFLKPQQDTNASTTLTGTNNMLVLSQWLPSNQTLRTTAAASGANDDDTLDNDDSSSTTRLPPGPMYQVGVGCFVLHPHDATKMLVVQERTGPAATYKLWKMPTGLVDAHDNEDIHQAAIRELYEETGLRATFQGIVLFRQAHAMGRRSGIRGTSDLFFVCLLKLITDNDNNSDTDNNSNSDKIDDDMMYLSHAKLCPNEIADIRWMSIDDYAQQALWQKSPLYQELNRALLHVAHQALFTNTTLPLGRLLQRGIASSPPSSASLPTDTLEKDKKNEGQLTVPEKPASIITNTIYKSQL
jgi:ADP-ribose pyrophosphatase YjhB (NUDIX family)